MSGCVREQQQIVWSVLIVRRHENGHELLQKLLARCVVRKQRVSVHVIQVALVWMGASTLELVDFFSCLEAKKIVEPGLDWIIYPVTNRLIKGDFLQLSP